MTLVILSGVGWLAAAQAQQVPHGSSLRIEIADSGREILDGLVPYLTTTSQLGVPAQVSYATAPNTLRDFCKGIGGSSPDIILTTRRVRSAVVSECGRNGIEHISQVELGSNAIILAVRTGTQLTKLTARDVYLALARDVPDQKEFRRNLSVQWSDIDPKLPKLDIRFQIAPREDGSRSVFSGLLLETGCREEPLVKAIFAADERTTRCSTVRVDRVREIPREQSVTALLDAPPGTVGVISYSDLQQAKGKLVGLTMDDIEPTDANILDGKYDYENLYYLYAKRGQALRGRNPAVDVAVDRIIAASLTEQMLGPNGIVAKLGLIPLLPDDRTAQRTAFSARPATFDVTSTVETWVDYAVDGGRALLALSFGLPQPPPPPGTLDFTSLMDIAGYKTQEFRTSIGIIPSAGMTFGIAREMSDADQDFLERKLAQDAHLRPGAVPALQRNIVRSILDVSETAGYQINRVEIELLPLPSFNLVVAPSDEQPSQETTSILDAISRLNNRLSDMLQ